MNEIFFKVIFKFLLRRRGGEKDKIYKYLKREREVGNKERSK